MSIKCRAQILEIIKQSLSDWNTDNAARLGAALSYYTVFSLAPVLVLVIAIAGAVFGREAAQGRIMGELSGMMGKQAAELVQSALASSSLGGGGWWAGTLSVVTLIIGATGVMVELQGALNTVWKVMPRPGLGIKHFIFNRLLSLALVMTIGFLLLVSLVLSAGLEAFAGWMKSIIPGWVVVGYIINYGVSLAVVALFFALLYKFLPDAKVAWRDVGVGAAITSLLFHLGKFLIALYIGRASVGSAFGAAGSLAVVLVWIYYSSQIVLLGAEFTRVYANTYGSRVVPDKNAVEAPAAAPERQAAEKSAKLGTSPPPTAESGRA